MSTQESLPVSLRDITGDNFEDVIRLKVRDDQTGFVASNVYSLAESKIFPDLIPLAIYAGEKLVGFTMYGAWPERKEYWIMRLMISAEEQGKGYGRASMQQVIERLRSFSGCDKIKISYEPHNLCAKGLYASLGFAVTGEMLEEEEVACLMLKADNR